MTGPLQGIRVLEVGGIGPGPFAAMVLADLGADVVRIDRPAAAQSALHASGDLLARGRRSVVVDLKHPEGVEVVLSLAESSDALIEGFRPGVAERLGVGPDVCLERNPRLVYGRMTGWGQDGPYAHRAGHDIDYIALAGALELIGRPGQPPTPPLNLVGDFGGGGMLLALGIACALVERASSGKGQVIDAAIVDGAALLTTLFHSIPMGRGATGALDGSAPYYDVYECADGKHVAIGAVEPEFYAELRRVMELDGPEWDAQRDRATWPDRKAELAARFRTRSRSEWCAAFEGADACFAPVLSLDEAPHDPHNVARGTFVDVDGVVQPGPAPRFSRTPGTLRRPPVAAGQDTDEVLAEFGFEATELTRLPVQG